MDVPGGAPAPIEARVVRLGGAGPVVMVTAAEVPMASLNDNARRAAALAVMVRGGAVRPFNRSPVLPRRRTPRRS